MSQTCSFCQVIAGQLPAHVVVEDQEVLGFLDHRPLFRGHVLLVPKEHHTILSDLPADRVAHFFTTAQRLERAVEDGLGAAGSLILINNVISQSVPHLHLHVIPRNPKDGLRFWLGPRHPYDAENPAETYAEKIRAALAARE
ncbi:HIT family protein [Actinokineospora sp. G85]|uniref:HIT family protein n=1 Tax=Actinokineospora sp. G85 TaxID=3406626 RepID=UPI003C713168